MTIWIGLDPGSISGAVGALDSNGDYLDSFMIEHWSAAKVEVYLEEKDKEIDQLHEEIRTLTDQRDS